jgi:hypothetical protein
VLSQYIQNYCANAASDEAMHLLVGNKLDMKSKKSGKLVMRAVLCM